MSPSFFFNHIFVVGVILFLFLATSTSALVLQSSLLTVVLDDSFPRPLNYTHSTTGEVIQGSLTGWGFHKSISINANSITCGENRISTVYSPLPLSTTPPGSEGVSFIVTATCIVNFGSYTVLTPTLTLSGEVIVGDDPSVPSAGNLYWNLNNATLSDTSILLKTIDIVGLELITWRASPPTLACMYNPDHNGNVQSCGGDYYYTDAWTHDGIDEWWSFTWDSSTVFGQTDINTVASNNAACFDGAASRHSPGPAFSKIVGGWTPTSQTGASAISTTQHHTPFWSGLRSYDAPGRCSVFTISPSTIYANYLCGNGLPYSLTIGVFGDVTQDKTVSPDDILVWRRMQYPKAASTYFTTLPYKIQVDMTAYTSNANWNRLSFLDVLDYVSNMSKIFDSYPQTPILVGWQGLGHDTAYPAWDIVNIREDVGGSAQLFALSQGLAQASNNSRSSLSYHVNSDEAYANFNGTADPEFDSSICRTNVDHVTPWYSNCTLTQEQIPDCGIRCSISKTKDNAFFNRYERYDRMFSVIPPGLQTIHSDAWRDVGESWESEENGGYISPESEQRCGQQADSKFWASKSSGVSMGVEGNDGQAGDFLGVVSFQYHANGWDSELWGRVIAGTSLGFDLDVYCNNPGGFCGWYGMADGFYLGAKLYQLALTDELLGTSAEEGSSNSKTNENKDTDTKMIKSQTVRYHRFSNGGKIYAHHTNMFNITHSTTTTTTSFVATPSPPSTWPYGGDTIPVANSNGGVFVPLITADGTLDNNTIHVYQKSTTAPPDPTCPLYQTTSFVAANNTALGDWNGDPYSSVELDPSLPEIEVVQQCNASCWSNASCAGWDLIKVTPSSGKTKPVCSLYTIVVGCQSDPNQWAGVKSVLPIPSPGYANQTWTLPLSWVGSTITPTTLTPEGPVPDSPILVINNREIILVNMTPGFPVRLTRS